MFYKSRLYMCVYVCVAGGGPASNGGGGREAPKQHTRARRTQRRVTHNEKRYHSGSRPSTYLFAVVDICKLVLYDVYYPHPSFFHLIVYKNIIGRVYILINHFLT